MLRGKFSYLYFISSFNGHHPLTEYREETDSYYVTMCGMGMLVTSVECRFGPGCGSVQLEKLMKVLDSSCRMLPGLEPAVSDTRSRHWPGEPLTPA